MSLADLWAAVATHLWQTSFVLAGLALLALPLRGAPARVQHALWTAGLLKLVVPLAAGGALLRSLAPSGGPAAAGLPVDSVWVDPGARLVSGTSGPGPVWLLLTAVWAAGAAWLLFRLAREQLRARRLVGGAHPPRAREAERLAAALRGSRVDRCSIRIVAAPVGCAVAGLVRPRILVDRRVLALPPAELRAVLEHEDAHRRRFDPARALARRIVASLLFFFPAVAPLMRRLHETAEFAADEHALGSVDPGVYARALARVVRLAAVPAPDPAATGNAGRSLLIRRFARLSCVRRNVMPVHRLALVLAVALALGASVLPIASADDAASSEAEFDTPPRVVHQVAPEYPESAKEKGVEGRVLLEVQVDVEGAPRVVVREGVPDHPELDKAASDAVAEWRFEPAQKDGEPVAATVLVPIEFKMNDEESAKAK
jgi:TonB family protein